MEGSGFGLSHPSMGLRAASFGDVESHIRLPHSDPNGVLLHKCAGKWEGEDHLDAWHLMHVETSFMNMLRRSCVH